MIDLEKTREFFSNDKYASEATGIVIDAVSENYAKTSLVIGPKHLNARGGLMGAVPFTMADFTFAVATNAGKDEGTVSTVSSITHLSPPKGKSLIAESSLVRDGKTLCTYDIIIKDELGTLVAKATVTGMHLRK